MAEVVDPLLAELAGDPHAKVENVDVLPTPNSPDPLEVGKKAEPTPVQKMDAQHSTAAGGKGYRVTVKGEYYCPAAEDPRRKLTKDYEIQFNLPHLNGALSTIKNKLLEKALRQKYKDYLGFRTYEITEARPLSPETPESSNLQFMPRPGLEAFVRDNRVPLNPVDYAETQDLRAAVTDFVLNPRGFEEREKRKQADRAEMAELAKLNPELA